MKNWFLITSAINVEYGIFDAKKVLANTSNHCKYS